jgi:hypothetical protein
MKDTEPQPLAGRNIDLGYASSESRVSSPPPVQGNSSKHAFPLADDDESAPSTPQDLADSTLSGIGHATEYIAVLAIKRW